MRIFVVWDLTSPKVRDLLGGLTTAISEIPGSDGEEPTKVQWESVLPESGTRKVARSVIWRGIQQADRVLVLFDGEKPEAGVGWKVGLALGWRKPIHVACVGAALPRWVQTSMLKMLAVTLVTEPSGVAALLSQSPVALPEPEPQKALPSGIHNVGTMQDPGILLLCPGGPAGRTLRDTAQDLLFHCNFLPDDGLRLGELPKLLRDRSGIFWVLAPDAAAEAVNTAHAIVAGMAEASGCDVTVLRSSESPIVQDVQPRELLFRSVAEFRQKLMPSRPPPDSLPPTPSPIAGSGLQPETSGNIVVAAQVLADIEPGHTPPAISRDGSSEEHSLEKHRTRRTHAFLALAALAMAIAGLLALRGTAPQHRPSPGSYRDASVDQRP